MNTNFELTWFSGMSWLQREVERRKTCYLECVVRKLYLKRADWDKALYEDIDKEFEEGSKSEEEKKKHDEERQKRAEHLNDDLIKRSSICEARGYRAPPAKDKDLQDICDKIQRFEQALASGIDLQVAKRWYGDLTIKPLITDGYKYDGLARLELARRYPDRRRSLFAWDPKSKEPKQKSADGYWLELVKESIDHLHLFWDTADFHANDFLRIIYLYGQTPETLRYYAPLWRPRDQLNRDPDFSATVERQMITALLEFKYWMDEQPRAEHCGQLVQARKAHPKEANKDLKELEYEMTYWSENHQILFPAAEYLIGQWLPDGIFTPGRAFREDGKDPTRGDYTGRQRMDRAKSRILRWLNDRLRFGFSEWNAPGYYKEHLQALFNLADFCLDDEIRTRTHMVMDVLFFDVARFLHQGHFGATAGRAYFEHKNCGWEQGVADLSEMLFGIHSGIFSGVDPAPGMLASSRVYRVPDAIISIGQDTENRSIDHSRVSFDFNEAHEYGIGTDKEEDVMRWWSRSAWFCKDVITRTREIAEQYNLMKTDLFSKILGITGSVDSPTLYIIAALSTLVMPPVGFSLLGLLEIIDEEEMADIASLMTEGSALTRANFYTYRNPDAMLSSVQNFRAGQYNFQTHYCQATLSMGATVWTTHPSAGSDLSAFKEFLEVVGGGVGGIAGWALGTALGNFANALLSGMLPIAPVAAGAFGAYKGGEAGIDIGESISEIKIIKPNHDGPNWWTGSVTVPRVVQIKNAAIIAYNPHTFQEILFGHRTHAWFPKDAFDQNADADDRADYAQTPQPGPIPTPMPQVDTSMKIPIIPSLTPVPSLHCNVDSGAWIFGRVGDGYVALYSGQWPEWTTSGDWANKEIMAEGKRNIFIIQIGNKEEFGSYINFKRRVLSARIHINGLHWGPSNFECSYDVPNGSRLELHYDEDQVHYAGLPFSDDYFPRFENKYAHVAWQQNKYAIQDRGHSLIHDIQKGERRLGGDLESLEHDANLKIYVQNTGLFPSDLMGLPVTVFPLYKGTERDRAVRKLIEVLRVDAFDIVGLSEMWHPPDRNRILRELGYLYPHHLEGPDEGDLERFDGGLLLLSRHKIVESHQTIYRQCEGEDCFANKGALHARIQQQGLPCPIDVFLSHTQGPAPTIGKTSDAHQVIKDQIRHLSAFIHSCRDARYPALLMGDLNVDGLNDPDQYGFLIRNLNGTTMGLEESADDLKPFFTSSSAPGKHFEATSENENEKVSSFNDGNSARGMQDDARFRDKAERLDYLFSWPGTIFKPVYPPSERKIVMHQSSQGRDLSDHYGLEARLSVINQSLKTPAREIHSISVRMIRFWCLETTSGPGDDEVQFDLRVVTGNGIEKSSESQHFEDVDEGTERLIESTLLEFGDPGEFLIIVVSGKEEDDFSADDSLGHSKLWLTRFELLFLVNKTVRRVLSRLTGDGGEYAVEVEIDVK